MAEGKAVYIVSVSYGYVLAHQTKGSPSQTVVQARIDGDDLQKWFIEKTDEEGVVAIRNAKTGAYINCSEQRCWGKIKCDDNRQLWKYDQPDEVHPPGAVRLQPVGFGKVFMNHHGPGRPKRGDAGVAAHMWDWVYDFNTTWYFQTTDKLDGSTMLSAALSGADNKAGEDVQAKLKDIEAREAALATEKSKQQEELEAERKKVKDQEAKLAEGEEALQKKLADKEAELAEAKKAQEAAVTTDNGKQQEDLQAQQRKIREKEAKLAEAEKKQKADFETKQKDLADREAALAKRERNQSGGTPKKGGAKAADFEAKLKDLHAREQALAAKEKIDAADKEANLKDVQKREHDLAEREKELAKQQAAAAKQPANGEAKANQSKPTANNATKDDHQLRELQDRLARLETQMASTQPSQHQPPATKPPTKAPPASRPANTKPAASLPPTKKPSTARPARANPGPHIHTASCGHPLRLPPRKLDRKVVGMIYEA